MANGPVIKVQRSSADSPLLENNNDKNSVWGKLAMVLGAVFLLGLLGVNMQPSQRQQGGVSVLTHISSGADIPSNPDCVGWNAFTSASDPAQYTFCKKRNGGALNRAAFTPVMSDSIPWVFRCTFKAPISLEHKGDVTVAQFKLTPSDGSKERMLHLKYDPHSESLVLTKTNFVSFGGSDAAAVDQIFGATHQTAAHWTVTLTNQPGDKDKDKPKSTRFHIEYAGDGVRSASQMEVPAQSQTLVDRDALTGALSLEAIHPSVMCVGVTKQTQAGAEYSSCDLEFDGKIHDKKKKDVAEDKAVKKPAEEAPAEVPDTKDDAEKVDKAEAKVVKDTAAAPKPKISKKAAEDEA